VTIVMYDLTGAKDRRFSPHCWRTRMAIAHKGLRCDTRPTRFADIASIGDGQQKTVPVIDDGGKLLSDSWAIANHLETKYPDRPTLFGGTAGRALTIFVQGWTTNVLHGAVVDLVVLDIHDQLDDADKAYFRASRERRFGRTLEEVQAGREGRVDAFRKSLQPLRTALGTQQWLGGDAPLYVDYLVFGAFQWARIVSRFRLLADDDPITNWFARCLDLFDGIGRRALTPA